jgi:EmrB/QacA subfamily drug resistance transporter
LKKEDTMNREDTSTDRQDRRHRWVAFSAICLAVLMIVLDVTIVYVALPSIRADLRLTDASLVWVANSYTLTYAGFLLLGGKLADVYGHRRVFLGGVGIFTLASLACGLAGTESLLVLSRAVQGVGGALVMATAVALLLNTFVRDAERAEAMSMLAFVSVSGSSVGFLLGGVITSTLNWHWIFLVNLPIGVSIFIFVLHLLGDRVVDAGEKEIDFLGAVTVTVSLILATYAILNEQADKRGASALELLVVASFLFVIFVIIEARVAFPLVPLAIFRRRDFALASTVGFLWGMGTASLFFVGLYMQLVLQRGPMQAGLAFLPMSGTAAAFSFGLSAKIVTRFGIKRPLSVGLLLAAISLVMLARVPVAGSLAVDVFPCTVLFGISVGLTASPLLLAATRDALPEESGLTSGVYMTISLMGSLFGLAILASLSAERTEGSLVSGLSSSAALAQGYRIALLGGATCSALAAFIAGVFLRTPPRSSIEFGIPQP